ncbi:helix-turn-helix domain-containing protein [Myxococcus sp. Y35]|uniref:helix-turn-helix domain-containing protein n=1 Tax=Pseudomyxococcus flavus TaxID=3115648 RepID=UPI003CF2B019
MRSNLTPGTVPENGLHASWREVVSSRVAGSRWEPSEQAEPFVGQVHLRTLGQFPLIHLDSVAQRMCRSARDIARAPRELYFVNLQLAGTGRLTQGREEHPLGPGDLTLVDLTRPTEFSFNTEWQGMSLALPQHVLRPRLADADRAVGRVVRTGTGVGTLASAYLRALLTAPPLTEPETDAAIRILLDVLALAFGATAEVAHAASPSTKEARRQRVREYVERHLADPSLTPASVAAELRMSKRYLHELFDESSTTLMQWVISRRLECCKKDLANPAMRARTIADIALGWGFRDVSHFGRVFRAAYGMAPREWRKIAATGSR